LVAAGEPAIRREAARLREALVAHLHERRAIRLSARSGRRREREVERLAAEAALELELIRAHGALDERDRLAAARQIDAALLQQPGIRARFIVRGAAEQVVELHERRAANQRADIRDAAPEHRLASGGPDELVERHLSAATLARGHRTSARLVRAHFVVERVG